MKFRNPFRIPSALELASRQLEDARRDSLNMDAWAEKTRSDAAMLKMRVKRLEEAVRELASGEEGK